MARKTTIGKDVILEAALQMLIADGYESINIRTLAEKIGCSSQPLVWKAVMRSSLWGALI